VTRIGRRRAIAAAALLAALGWLRCGPLPAGFLDQAAEQSTILLDRYGEVLYEARASDGGRALTLSSDALPPVLVAATIAAEDARFWHHVGVDPIGIARAAWHDLRHGEVVEGGSTITQQAAKLLIARRAPGGVTGRDDGGTRRSVAAKLRESLYALRLEHRLDKRAILALYLNLVSYGNQLDGAERASREYFGIAAAMLTPAQAAFLAGLPQRPSSFNPYRSRPAALGRQQQVLDRMGRANALSADALATARRERLDLRREPPQFIAPHFVTRVLATLSPETGGRVVTSLDATLQRTVQGIIRSQQRSLLRHGAHNVAVAVMDNRTGEWLAYEGSGNYGDTSHGGAIDGIVTRRQPGSALKPFTYALAFETGATPTTVLPDLPSAFATAEAGIVFRPVNYDGQFRGPMLARNALAGSENVPAVALAARVGVPSLLSLLRQAGFTTLDRNAAYYGVALTLGDAEVRLDELVTAYAGFARGGAIIQPRAVRASPMSPLEPSEVRIVSPRTAFWISDILSDDDARAFAFGRDNSLSFPFVVAAKTGTSQAYRDNWTVGYTRALTVGVWVGNFDRTPLVGSSGVTGAGPIFHDVMTAALERVLGRLPYEDDRATIAGPESVVRTKVCALSGMAAGPSCSRHTEEWVPVEAPLPRCDWHLADGVTAWPAEYRAWAHDRGLLSGGERIIPTAVRNSTPAPERGDDPRRDGMQLVNVPSGATYFIDPTLRSEFQTLALRASTDAGGSIEWAIDGAVVGTSASDLPYRWPLTPGKHSVMARDRMGRRAEASIVVK